MESLNDEFRRLLVSSGWTQSRAAEELRVDAGTISRYVSNTIIPSETVLRLFAELLGERLALPHAILPASMRDGPRHLEPHESRLLDALRTVPPDPRRKFIEAAMLLADAWKARPTDNEQKKPSSSAVDRAARQIAKMGAEAVHADGGHNPGAGVAEPSAPTSARAPGAPKSSTRRR